MKKYIGTKQIEAEPMTLGEACSKGLVKSEIEKNESYKLGYHTRTEYGYESWSPKKLFEESFPQSVRPKCRIMEEVVGRFLLQNPDIKRRIMTVSVRKMDFLSLLKL